MFVLSKLAGMLLQPVTLIFIVLWIGVTLLYTRCWRGGRLVLALLGGTLAVVAVGPWDAWLVAPMEDRFPPPRPLPARVDGIIVLGGALDPVVSAARGQVSVNGAVERLTALVELGRRYPRARLLFSGGSGAVTTQDLKEAPIARDFLAAIGFDADRVTFEGQSRNTRENALFSKPLAMPQPGEVWLVVTSALHMPRAMGVFRAAGWPVIPFPVDYRTTGRDVAGPGFHPAAGLSAVDAALHEWLGLVYYRLRGWTDSLYPAPAPL